jgi:penicillin-binding protein 1C
VAIESDSGLRACPGETEAVRHEVYEFWPSDLLALFRSAGIARRTPPAFAPRCGFEVAVVGDGRIPEAR